MLLSMIPLFRRQYSLLAFSELRSDESITDMSVLNASTVFEQLEDSLSISQSHITISPMQAPAKKVSITC